MVLDRILLPLDGMLLERAVARIHWRINAALVMVSSTNCMISWLDNITIIVPLINLDFSCARISVLLAPLCLQDQNSHVNGQRVSHHV